jgi:hypothetical protein
LFFLVGGVVCAKGRIDMVGDKKTVYYLTAFVLIGELKRGGV